MYLNNCFASLLDYGSFFCVRDTQNIVEGLPVNEVNGAS